MSFSIGNWSLASSLQGQFKKVYVGDGPGRRDIGKPSPTIAYTGDKIYTKQWSEEKRRLAAYEKRARRKANKTTTQGESFFTAIKCHSCVGACTVITSAALLSAAETKLYGRRSIVSRDRPIPHTHNHIYFILFQTGSFFSLFLFLINEFTLGCQEFYHVYCWDFLKYKNVLLEFLYLHVFFVCFGITICPQLGS